MAVRLSALIEKAKEKNEEAKSFINPALEETIFNDFKIVLEYKYKSQFYQSIYCPITREFEMYDYFPEDILINNLTEPFVKLNYTPNSIPFIFDISNGFIVIKDEDYIYFFTKKAVIDGSVNFKENIPSEQDFKNSQFRIYEMLVPELTFIYNINKKTMHNINLSNDTATVATKFFKDQKVFKDFFTAAYVIKEDYSKEIITEAINNAITTYYSNNKADSIESIRASELFEKLKKTKEYKSIFVCKNNKTSSLSKGFVKTKNFCPYCNKKIYFYTSNCVCPSCGSVIATKESIKKGINIRHFINIDTQHLAVVDYTYKQGKNELNYVSFIGEPFSICVNHNGELIKKNHFRQPKDILYRKKESIEEINTFCQNTNIKDINYTDNFYYDSEVLKGNFCDFTKNRGAEFFFLVNKGYGLFVQSITSGFFKSFFTEFEKYPLSSLRLEKCSFPKSYNLIYRLFTPNANDVWEAIGITESDVSVFKQPIPLFKFFIFLLLLKENSFSNCKDASDFLNKEEVDDVFSEQNNYFKCEIINLITLLENYYPDYKVIDLINYFNNAYNNQCIEYFSLAILYNDYLRLAVKLKYDLTNPNILYPKYLKKEHAIATFANNNITIPTKVENFKKNILENQKYEFKKNGYLIKIPVNPLEITKEGTALNHCVAIYINRIAEGDAIIAFLRKEDEPDTPYFTIAIENNTIKEVKGLSNRTVNDEKIKKFIKEWAKEKNLVIHDKSI